MRNDDVYLQLYLIRHAESMGNIETDVAFDKTNPPLTPLGKEQAKAVGERFSGFKPDALISSPLDRAYETAKEISLNTGTKIEIDDMLVECGTYVEESEDVCIKRAESVIGKIKEKYSENKSVVLVTHAGFIEKILYAVLECSTLSFCVYNTSVTKINFRKDKKNKLAFHNDISHLLNIDGDKIFWM